MTWIIVWGKFNGAVCDRLNIYCIVGWLANLGKCNVSDTDTGGVIGMELNVVEMLIWDKLWRTNDLKLQTHP